MPSTIAVSALGICFALQREETVMLRSLVERLDLSGAQNGIVLESPQSESVA